MAIEHVIVHKIDKAQPFEFLVHIGQALFDTICIALGIDIFRYSFSCKYVFDLTYSNHSKACLLQLVQHRNARRKKGIIVASCRPYIAAAFSVERPGYHTPHAVLALEHVPRHLTVFIELFHRYNILMGCNLKNTVR